MQFVLGHCGFIAIDLYSIDAVRDCENISLETSGCYTGIVRAAVERVGADRVLFGTEYPLSHPDVELTKLSSVALDPAHRQDVMWANACRLLREEADDPI